MLPSLLAREVQTGLKQFLTVGFEPSDPLFAGVMERFTRDESRWMKGPYVQLGLPFRVGGKGKHFFKGFETEHPGYVHQEAAWQRLASDHQAAPTLVATGTGSGKTECFLYPLLDHCARSNTAGVAGIKALVIYPPAPPPPAPSWSMPSPAALGKTPLGSRLRPRKPRGRRETGLEPPRKHGGQFMKHDLQHPHLTLSSRPASCIIKPVP